MAIGPIQIWYFKFDSIEHFQGQIRKAIGELRGKGLIRLIDVYFVAKALDGSVTRESGSDLSEEGAQRFGAAIKKAMGLDTPDAMSTSEALDLVGESLGLTATDLSKLEAEINPGEAGLVLMFEHTWAVPLREALKETGGRTVMQAFLSPDAVAMVGGEVNAILKAQEAVEEAEKVRNAARLDALVSMAGAREIAKLSEARAVEAVVAADLIEEAAAEKAVEAIEAAAMVKDAAMQDAIETVVEADAIKAAAVADTLRVLIEAGQIEQAAVEDVMNTLVVAGLIEQAAIERANAAALTAGE